MSIGYVSDDLILLLMKVAIELPSDHVLVPVDYYVESSAIGSKALLYIRNMTNFFLKAVPQLNQFPEIVRQLDSEISALNWNTQEKLLLNPLLNEYSPNYTAAKKWFDDESLELID